MEEKDRQRLAQFEKMKAAVEQQHSDTINRLEALRTQGKQKSATYTQLLGNKMNLENILQLYKLYDIDEVESEDKE